MSDEDEARSRSKRVFGNRYMLEVCVALGEVTDRINLVGLVGDSGLSASVYVGPLRRLEEVGLLILDPRPGDDRRERWFRPASSGLWQAALELAER